MIVSIDFRNGRIQHLLPFTGARSWNASVELAELLIDMGTYFVVFHT